MPDCGSQIILCGLPIRFDTYHGCSHLCKYCFTQKKYDLTSITTNETAKALNAFIQGQRTRDTRWCDWDIPLHWGGLSDPFQPVERKVGNSLQCLRVFAQTQYPFVVSTKGRLVTEPEYLELLSRCNCVVQISAVCSEYDVLEPGAPSFTERVSMIAKLAPRVKRVIVRIQPYMTEVREDVLVSLEQFKKAGAYGVVVEGMKFVKRKNGLVKIGGDFGYPLETLRKDFLFLREKAHRLGLRFYCGENRLRALGDSLTCCGVDGLDGFRPNEYNLCSILNGSKSRPTAQMQAPDTASCFSAIMQRPDMERNLRGKSFQEAMWGYYATRKEYIHELFGKSR